jgi:hypothetical protein
VKRFLATVAIPLAALGGLGLAACGDDDDDSPSTTVSDTGVTDDTEASDDTGSGESLPGGTLPGGITVPSLPDISIPDVSVDPESLLRQVFPNLDDEQVSCLADALGDISSDFDASQVMNVLGECNIPISDIAPGG